MTAPTARPPASAAFTGHPPATAVRDDDDVGVLHDISPAVDVGSPVFPGDEPFAMDWRWRLGDGVPVNVATLRLSPHTGAHADAPLHYADGERPIGAVPLAPYLGRCRVIHAIGARPLVTAAHVAGHLGDPALPSRVLLRTWARQPSGWVDDFAAIDPPLLGEFAARGVRLVGIDTASIDPSDSKSLDSHAMLRRHDLRVLENLVLDEVAEGDYELVALPLKLARADASPVRAVLRAWRP